MELPAVANGFDAVDIGSRPLHLAIGMFDGVHLGHRAVIDTVVENAHRADGVSAVLSFTPHPSRLLRPESPTLMINPPAVQARLLHEAGVDLLIRLPFTREFSQTDADAFLPWLKASLPGLQSIAVGANFRFGRRRTGDLSQLLDQARGMNIAVFAADRLQHNGEAISSTRIREALQAGRIAEANAMLGHNYFAEGEVIPSRGLGRKIGFPTLNLRWDPECRPRFGVYSCRARATDTGTAAFQPAVANYGVRPTVEETQAPLLEVHLLEPTTLSTGDRVRVEWLHFLRPERRFDSVEELRAQIAEDVTQARGMA